MVRDKRMQKKLILALLPILTAFGPVGYFAAAEWLANGKRWIPFTAAVPGEYSSNSSGGNADSDSSSSSGDNSNSGDGSNSGYRSNSGNGSSSGYSSNSGYSTNSGYNSNSGYRSDSNSSSGNNSGSGYRSSSPSPSYGASAESDRSSGATNPPTSTGPSQDKGTQAICIVDLAEAFRFDVTPGWIIGRWPLVSAGLAFPTMHGYRVPLVTGTQPDDLTGAMTYYFNPQQQVQRITFQGTTGDAGRLIQLLVAKYHFGRRLTNDPSLIRYEVPESSGKPKSLMEIRAVRPTDLFRRFDVILVVERPAT